MYRVLLTPFVLTFFFPPVPAPNVTDTKDWCNGAVLIATPCAARQACSRHGPKTVRRCSGARAVNGKDNVGRGYASIAIVGGKIYTLGDRMEHGNVICLDEATGKVLWVTPFSPTYGDGGPRCTPTVDSGRVYGLSPHGILVCTDAGDGHILWKKDLKADFGGRMMSGWNYSESPLIDGDKIVCTPGGKKAGMIALNKDTGARSGNARSRRTPAPAMHPSWSPRPVGCVSTSRSSARSSG